MDFPFNFYIVNFGGAVVSDEKKTPRLGREFIFS